MKNFSNDELIRKNRDLRQLNAKYEVDMDDYRKTIKKQEIIIERLRQKLNDNEKEK